ncbi:Endospore coat-associated protein YheD [Paenibacillus solanacearum]|uniref:Endospore coat-associated protein YheD n=1 Tax=Paenibacillus solanacearum TaxID=2048548 RepID=A0A916KAE9_9BACL|nr:YheC/YheD family protein [Paenibacillus solanacearum]CAG7652508.1 Endospore coat-associated protein YheD [Paenibacillus solanacearum]
MSTTVASKWKKTKVLLESNRIAKVIPETRKFSPEALQEMLAQYGSVIAKPCSSAGGHGIVKISRKNYGYKIRYKGMKKKTGKFSKLVRALRRLQRRRKYILQRTIDLAQIDGRPVDYRVKLVRKGDKWKVTALVAKVARKGYFITNICRGGDLMRSSEAIRRSLNTNPRRKKRKMVKLSRKSAKILAKKFPGITQLGFDYGLDKDGKIWMFEVNTNPH